MRLSVSTRHIWKCCTTFSAAFVLTACGASSALYSSPELQCGGTDTTWILETGRGADGAARTHREIAESLRRQRVQKAGELRLIVKYCKPQQQVARGLQMVSYLYGPAPMSGERGSIALARVPSNGRFLLHDAKENKDLRSPFSHFDYDVIVETELSWVAEMSNEPSVQINLEFERIQPLSGSSPMSQETREDSYSGFIDGKEELLASSFGDAATEHFVLSASLQIKTLSQLSPPIDLSATIGPTKLLVLTNSN